MSTCRLSTLGRLELTRDGKPALTRRRKELALLAFLARRAPRRVDRAVLAAMLWGDTDEARGRQSLRQALSDLRDILGEALEADAVSVRVAGTVQVDAAEFEREVSQERWRIAVDHWKGPFLAGLDDLGDERWVSWLEAERSSLSTKLAYALDRLAADTELRGDWEQAIHWAEWQADVLPRDEAAAKRLITVLLSAGRLAEARARLAVFRKRLRDDLDAEPNPELERLVQLAVPRAAVGGPGSRGLLSPDLTAREDALALLSHAWDRSRAGAGRVVIVQGDEGLGKTRLLADFVRAIRRREPDALLLDGTAFASEQGEAYAALRPLVARLALAPGASAAPPESLARLAQIAPEIRERYRALPESSPDEPLGRHLDRLWADVAQEQPVLVALDDVPLADRESQAAMAGLLRRPPPHVLLILAGRPEAWTHSLLAGDIPQASAHLDRIALAPLSANEVEHMLGSMAPFAPEALTALSGRLHAQTGGVPAQIEQLVHQLAADGLITPGPSGSWVLGHTAQGPLPLPSGVRELMERRLGRLSAEARDLMESCAVLGPNIDPVLLEGVSGLNPPAFQRAMSEVLSQRLLREGVARPGRYEFPSDAYRRAVSDLTAPSRRKALHLRASHALEQGPQDAMVRESIAAHRALAGPPRSRTVRRVATGLAVATGVVGLIGLGIVRGSRAANLPPGAAILLADVTNTTGDSLLDRTLYTAALISLQQSQRTWVFPRARIPEVLARMGLPAKDTIVDERLGREIAQRENIGIVVQLAIAGIGSELLLSSRLIGATSGRDLRSFEVRVPDRNGVLAGLTRLLHDTRRALGESGAELVVRGDSLPQVTTTSLEALKAYAEGDFAWRKREYLRARELWLRAVELDSTFALAYLSLAEYMYDMEMAQDSGTRYLDRARAHAARLTERERLRLEQSVAFRQGLALQAAALAQTIAERYPSPSTLHNQAWILMRNEDCQAAIPVFRRVVAMSPSYINAWINLATCHNTLNQLNEALAAYEQAQRLDSMALIRDNINQEWGSTYLHLGRPAAAESAFRRMLGREEPLQRARGHRSLSHLAMYEGRYREAIRQMEAATAIYRTASIGASAFRTLIVTAHAMLSAGNHAGARARLEEARRLAGSERFEPIYYEWLGEGFVRLGDPDRAGDLLRIVRPHLIPTKQLDSAVYRFLAARIAGAEGRPLEVIELLSPLADAPWEASRRFLLGSAYMDLGFPDSALVHFTQGRATWNWGWEGQEEWVRLPLLMAQAAELVGDSALARKAYGEFLAAWRRADSSLPELRLARANLERLQAGLAR